MKHLFQIGDVTGKLLDEIILENVGELHPR